MPLFRWDRRYATGVQEIDDQHKKLMGLMNELHDAMRSGKGKEVSRSILSELMDYSIYHFRTEEKMMRERSYPEMELHIKQHSDFMIRVEDLSRRLSSGEYMMALEINEFLKEWLSGHILSVDKEMGKYIR